MSTCYRWAHVSESIWPVSHTFTGHFLYAFPTCLPSSQSLVSWSPGPVCNLSQEMITKSRAGVPLPFSSGEQGLISGGWGQLRLLLSPVRIAPYYPTDSEGGSWVDPRTTCGTLAWTLAPLLLTLHMEGIRRWERAALVVLVQFCAPIRSLDIFCYPGWLPRKHPLMEPTFQLPTESWFLQEAWVRKYNSL